MLNPLREIMQEKITSFCQESIGGCDYCEKLAGDASTRQYYRVQYSGQTYIVCYDPMFVGRDLSVYPFYQVHALFCEHHIPVPKVYRYDNSCGLILQEDCGDFLVEDFVGEAKKEQLISLYEKLLQTIVLIQNIKSNGSIPFFLFFDEEKLMFEFNFFLDNAFEKYFRVSCPEQMKKELVSHFYAIAHKLQRREFFVLCHRDFHSRNVLVTPKGFFLIDFQDARMGLPLYDVVSLLRDSYVLLPEDVYGHLKDYYFFYSREMEIHRMSRDEFEYLFSLSAFQRNVKALGTFGFQIVQRGNHRYRPYVEITLEYLKKYAQQDTPVSPVARILINCIEGCS
ncbi:MAG: phosphotransferase [Spirochaetes bacterium]|nr:phosphotransferase [Spirochaetota bacterium]